jgi:hypothetical protein
MLDRPRVALAAAVVLAGAMGCDSITGPDLLEQFTWGEIASGEPVEEGIDVSQALADIFILGEFNTPTKCYNLSAELERSGGRLTLRVEANSTNTPNCTQAAGAYRYTAVIRNLSAGDYEVRVVHAVGGGETREFTESITID